MVVVGARAVDDLHQLQRAGVRAAVLGGVGLARGLLERRALPAVVLRVRGREVAVDLLEVGFEATLVVLELAPARDRTPDREHDDHEHDDHDDDLPGLHGAELEHGYWSTARESRCAPTLRFTRWSALSTVLQSQSSCSPMPV